MFLHGAIAIVEEANTRGMRETDKLTTKELRRAWETFRREEFTENEEGLCRVLDLRDARFRAELKRRGQGV